MSRIDFASAAKPLKEDDPCGLDLDMAGDEDFLNFVAIAEGLLPTEYFKDGEPFASTGAEFEDHMARIEPLLARTRDVRLFSLLARFSILRRDYTQFAACLDAIAGFLEHHWDDVHPRADGGAFALRAAALSPLNEPTVVFPLQYMPLAEDKRQGSVTYRARMCADGAVKPREGERILPAPIILEILRESDAERLAATISLASLLASSLERIQTAFAEHCGLEKTPTLTKIRETVAGINALLKEATKTEDEQETEAEAGAAAITLRLGKLATASDARRALDAVTAYFRRREPSSPVLPLVAQAREIQGKPFAAVMEALLPRKAGDAEFMIGDRKFFALPLEILAPLTPEADGYAEDDSGQAKELEAIQEGPSVEDAVDWNASNAEVEDKPERHGEEEVSAGLEDENAPMPGELARADEPDADAAKQVVPGVLRVECAKPAASKRVFAAGTRAEAMALLDDVVQYFQVAEPSSPIPWLIGCAKQLANKDFLSVLSSVLPENALRDRDGK
jgi:type VI secretion system protein ImpA